MWTDVLCVIGIISSVIWIVLIVKNLFTRPVKVSYKPLPFDWKHEFSVKSDK